MRSSGAKRHLPGNSKGGDSDTNANVQRERKSVPYTKGVEATHNIYTSIFSKIVLTVGVKSDIGLLESEGQAVAVGFVASQIRDGTIALSTLVIRLLNLTFQSICRRKVFIHRPWEAVDAEY